jgi:signal recognition particle receptor subunit alpha
MKEAQEAKTRGVPYSIVFIGINGVGKSTSLAKVAYLLKERGKLKVLIAACDNFRSGAVEQLK